MTKETLFDKVVEQVMAAGGLREPDNTEQMVGRIIDVVEGAQEPSMWLKRALEKYLLSKNERVSDPELERIYCGMMAFLWTNLYQDPYYPIEGIRVEEKKWWEFWK